ncbi:SGNH/GDSL hydrolase family protein [uncultured Paludibaculum sp.]|uniref:SGNH/GDSL hydrolase family protein n=1 Tax=uncultured Paludibaculum sp. TaxID=1765020 RepID=UPI002AABDB31|nr:SGNH/GDSL hydrolase family protein [uncultured Paludibaculum sp.]
MQSRRELFLLTMLSLAPVAAAAPLSGIYFFGDSLSDTGNVGNLTAGLYPNTPYTPGRFSNGPVWTEYFAQSMGLPNAAKAAGMSLGPNYFNLEISGNGGTNYAIGGARNDTTGTLDSYGIPSGVYWQLYYYVTKANLTADPAALYVLFGGGNDLRDASLLSPAERDAAAAVSAEYLVFSMYILEQLGARNFLVLNAPDIGNTPEAKLVRNNEAAATAATQAYNTTLGFYVNYFQTALPRSTFHLLDTYSLFEGLYADAQNGGSLYGLTNATTPCFAGYAGSPGADCATSVFADDIHPTTAAHHLLANAAYDLLNPPPAALLSSSASLQITATPEPSAAWMCVTGLGLLAWSRRRTATRRRRP